MTKTDTWQTRPLVREGAPKKKLQDCNFQKKKLWSKVPYLGSTPRHTDWLTVSRNVTDFDFDLIGHASYLQVILFATLTSPVTNKKYGLLLLTKLKQILKKTYPCNRSGDLRWQGSHIVYTTGPYMAVRLWTLRTGRALSSEISSGNNFWAVVRLD
jgi:hypothetical protein